MMKHKVGILSLAMATIVLVSMVAVVGVSAAPSSSENVQAPHPVCAPCGAIASCYDGAASVYYYVAQGAADVHGNTIYWKTSLVGGTWKPIGTGTTPTVVYLGAAGNVAVLATGTNGVIWAKVTTNGGTTWSSKPLPTSVAAGCTGPTAVFLAATPELDVFYVNSGNNHLMWDSVNLDTASSSQADLGGIVLATPAATTTSTGGMVVVVKGTDGIYERLYEMGGWGPWTKFHDGTIGYGASLASDNLGDLFLAVSGSNRHLYLAWSTDDGQSWVTNYQQGLVPLNTHALYWKNLGGVVTSAPSAVFPTGFTGCVNIFVRGTGCNIWDYVICPGPFIIPPFLFTGSWSGPFLGP
jgi:hypothetical protein